MADIAKTTNELFWGYVDFLLNQQGTLAVDSVGYTNRGTPVNVSAVQTVNEHMVNELEGPAAVKRTVRGVKVSAVLDQFHPRNLAHAMGVTPAAVPGGFVLGGGSQDAPEVEARLVGTRKDGRPLHIYLPKAVVTSEASLDFSLEAAAGIPLELTALDDSTLFMAQIYIGLASAAVTIATGTLTRTKATANKYDIALIAVAGQSAAADDLTTIAGASLVDGEIVRIKAANPATEVITMKDLTGTLEMKANVDFVLDKTDSWIDLRYNLAGTKWVELSNYTSPV